MKSKVGLVGSPIKHSLSPFIHQLMHEVPYELFETTDLESVVSKEEVIAVNITAPLKEKAYQLASFLDEGAKATHSVNTLVKTQEGLSGYNTDILALNDMFKAHLNIKLSTPIAIIGNGATHRSVLFALKSLGYTNICVFARHPIEDQLPFNVWKEDIKVIINTTPMGMHHLEAVYPFPKEAIGRCLYVMDVVYAPLFTPFIQEARRLKIPYGLGMSMLVRQAMYAASLMGVGQLKTTSIQAMFKSTLSSQLNIVLIGLPYSGKSTFAKALSSELNRPYYDLDAILEVEVGQSISSYIQQHGIEAFRAKEKALLMSLKTLRGSIIATGGGTVLDQDNVNVFKSQGVFVWMQADPPLFFDGSRPLCQSLEDYQRLKTDRSPLYQQISDIKLTRQSTMEKTMEAWRKNYETYLHHQRP
jgi:shikimate dehydrogenase